MDIGEYFFMERVVQPCPHPQRDLTAVWRWHLGTGVGGGLGGAGEWLDLIVSSLNNSEVQGQAQMCPRW